MLRIFYTTRLRRYIIICSLFLINSGIEVFFRHAREGGYPGLLARRFLDSAKASLRALPPAQHHTGAGTQE